MRAMLRKALLAGVVGALVLAVFTLLPSSSPAAAVPDPALDIQPNSASGTQTAVLAGGCFWCTETVFEHVKGVEDVVSGYAGGDSATARYDLVSAGKTKHIESIEIVFDPNEISYGQILKVFFGVAHDPTQVDRQGPDWGKQYRSAIFWRDAEQKKISEAYIAQLEKAGVFDKPIATELIEFDQFYPAEKYHQDFVKRNPTHPYVVVNALPKMKKLEKTFPDLYRK